MTYPKEIQNAFAALAAVEEERSVKEKTAILQAHEDNQVLKSLLYYAFNSFLQYYIKQIPEISPANKAVDPENYTGFLALLNDLNDRKFTDVKGHVAEFLKKCNEEEQLWYTRVLLRDLHLGITQKGVNKAFKGLIPAYDVLLAESVKDVTLSDPKTIQRLPEAFVLQYKIDGYRLNLHKAMDGTVTLKTRSGLDVTGYDRLIEEASRVLPSGRVYDGEMVSPELFSWIGQNMLGDTGDKIADRSLFREAVRKCFSRETGKEGVFNIFDTVSKHEWDTQEGKESYESRLASLNQMEPLLNSSTQMAVVPTSRVFYKNNPDDIQEVLRIFHKFLSWGWEGAMIKAVDAPYEWKRSKRLLKMKMMDTADLEVLSLAEGTGAGEGMVGKLICDYKGTILNIGTGKMTAQEKRKYWNNPNLIVGKTIEVLYQAESTGKNGEPVLDFARYQKIRKDK